MIISDDERREVADKLRERTKRKLGKSMQLMFSETLGLYRTNICWSRKDKATETWDAIVNYLADLIDRPMAKREDAGDYWRCTHCGAFTRKDALADRIGFMPAHRCGNCGREWEL